MHGAAVTVLLSAALRCECLDGWMGESCNQMRCPDDCGGHGLCHEGRCLVRVRGRGRGRGRGRVRGRGRGRVRVRVRVRVRGRPLARGQVPLRSAASANPTLHLA